MPRILHVSDTHLGFQAYSKLTPEGLNRREVDFLDAFRRVVDHAVADPPDLFLHTGDVFDQVRPPNRAIAFALEQVRRLSQAGIPTILLSGNHDAPRLRETGSIFRVFDGLPHVHPVYRGELARIGVGDLVVHAVPQAASEEAFQLQLAQARPEGPGLHVLAVHGTVLGVEGLFTSEFNELHIPAGALDPGFAYIALGHFHKAKRVAPNAWYAGSTEYASFAEAGQEKVFLDVEVTAEGPRVTPCGTGARPMRDAGRLDAARLEPEELVAQASDLLAQHDMDGGILRLTLERVPRPVARTLDLDAIRAGAPRSLHVDLRLVLADEDHAQSARLELGTLPEEFEAFLKGHPIEDGLRGPIRAAALQYLVDAGGSRAA